MPLKDLQNYVAGQTEITDTDMNTLGQAVRILRNIAGPNVIVDGNGVYFRSQTKSTAEGMWILLGSSVQDGTNKRWKYPWIEVEKTSAGYGGWTAAPSGRGGPDDTFDYAYNGTEDANLDTGPTGLYGNGVYKQHLIGSYDLQPAPTIKVIVRAWIVPVNDDDPDTKLEVWFNYENGVDGTCEEI